MMSLLGEDLAHADNPILTALTSYMSWCNPPLFVWPLTSLHRDSPAAGHRVWWQGVVPGGEGASDGCCAYGTQCKCVHHLRGAWQPQLAGKWRKTWPYYSLNLYTMCKLTMVLCCAALQDSILDIKVPIFKGPGELPEIRSYMEEFPFPFYVILRDVNALPETLSDALRQWFELVTAADQ